MRTGAAFVLITFVLLFAACSSGQRSANRPAVASATRPPAAVDLRQLPTGTPGPAGEGAAQAAGYARASLAAFPSTSLQLLVPQLFSDSSALDLLRLSTAVGAPAKTVPSLLQGLGWRWLALADGIEGGSYRQWRVAVLGFDDAGGAAQYLARPFLLARALAEASGAGVPAGLAADTRLLRAADTVVPLTNPATELAGERAALLWRRGRLVFQVIESAAPAPIDLTRLVQLAAAVDQHGDTIVGGEVP